MNANFNVLFYTLINQLHTKESFRSYCGYVRPLTLLTCDLWYEGIFMTLETGIMFANGPISGKQANGSLPNCPLRVLDVQSGMFSSGGQGSQDVTG